MKGETHRRNRRCDKHGLLPIMAATFETHAILHFLLIGKKLLFENGEKLPLVTGIFFFATVVFISVGMKYFSRL